MATGDPLVDVDVIVHGLLQKLRTPWLDSAIVAATELGDVQVALPVFLNPTVRRSAWTRFG